MNAPLTQPDPTVADWDGLTADLNALGRSLRQEGAGGDLAHMRKIERWGRLCTIVGFATAWIVPNPLSILALSTGRVARWAMIGHHVSHRGYDRVGGPKGKDFGEGWRRYLDWLDWLVPAAWKHEHNVLHHYRLNEEEDPDLVEENVGWLRDKPWPRAAKLAVAGFYALTWRFMYYAPSTLGHLHHKGVEHEKPIERNLWDWDPRTPIGRDVWLRSLLPYIGIQFVLLPLLFSPLGWQASVAVLLNSLLAELVANLHSFLIIVPNHAGRDMYRFSTPPKGKKAFYQRQILGSVNYRTGGDLNDFAHGFLNYQIEHHLWPDLPMAAYQRAQPLVKALCAEHGVPYVQESVWTRVVRTLEIMTGDASMKVWTER